MNIRKKLIYIPLVIILLVTLLIFIFLRPVVNNINNLLEKKVQKRTLELRNLNITLEQKVKNQVADLREKDSLLMQSSKMAAIGDMIANIAHQWRQPLSVISSCSTGLIVKNELNKITNEELIENLNLINDTAQHLSKTIDTFKNFMKEDKRIIQTTIQNVINKSLSIVSSSLKNHHINIIKELEEKELKVSLPDGELEQVIINILNNSKDAIVAKQIKDAWVKIKLIKNKNLITISIEDNAGGIDEEVLPKIFEPYFTTKHMAQGTGLGLNISYRIVTESLDGKLYAKNTKDGVKFIIEILQ